VRADCTFDAVAFHAIAELVHVEESALVIVNVHVPPVVPDGSDTSWISLVLSTGSPTFGGAEGPFCPVDASAGNPRANKAMAINATTIATFVIVFMRTL
jgi:hypothetical protein